MHLECSSEESTMNDINEFLTDIEENDRPKANFSTPLQALWWEGKGDWETAHDIAQEAGSSEGDWIHAYLHRVEGDLGNAGYWYRRAGKPVKSNENLKEEWSEMVTFFLENQNEVGG